MKVKDHALMLLLTDALIDLQNAARLQYRREQAGDDEEMDWLGRALDRASSVIRRAKIQLSDCDWM